MGKSPFFMNLMHHFYNYLGGHGTTMYGVTGSVLNQNRGLEKGLEGLGLRVMKEMLSNKNGKENINRYKTHELRIKT
ncbi:MAG: hypothetical protein R2777_05355 [Chitinophagales bacterium]